VVSVLRSGAEEALYDIQPMRAFAALELRRDAIPDETIILKFRHLLKGHELTKAVLAAVAEHLKADRRSAARRHDHRCDAVCLRRRTKTAGAILR